MRKLVIVALTLSIGYSLIGPIQCENKTLGYKQDYFVRKVYEERIFVNSTPFQVKRRVINYPANGIVNIYKYLKFEESATTSLIILWSIL